MRVSGAGSGSDMQTKGTGMSPGMGEPMDEVSKGLQRQIENLQKQMKELSANQEMTPDMKMKKRQELQKQISELQIQLRQHQMEVKREEARKKEEKASQDDVLNPTRGMEQKQGQSAGLSAGSMEVMLSADASMKQAGVHGSTAKHAQNRAGILEAEIKQDKGGPGDASASKEEALAEAKELEKTATASQMDSLGKAVKAASEAEKAEKEESERKEEDDEKNGVAGRQGAADAVDGTDAGASGSGSVQKTDGETDRSDAAQAPADQEQRRMLYHPVDVRI